MRKAFIAVFLAAIIAVSFSVPLSAAQDNTVRFVIGMSKYFVNDQAPGVQMDAAPYVDSGRTMIPVRYLADALGAKTDWNAAKRQVTVTGNGVTINLVIGSTTLTVNGKRSPMDVAPVAKEGRTYLPARYVAEALGYRVDWDGASKSVTVWKGGQKPTPLTVVNGFVVPADTKLFFDTATPPRFESEMLVFNIDTTRGDVQRQVADAWFILSQPEYLDQGTVARAMDAIKHNLAIRTPPQSLEEAEKRGVIDSPNGGSVIVNTSTTDNYKNMLIGVQILSEHPPWVFVRMRD